MADIGTLLGVLAAAVDVSPLPHVTADPARMKAIYNTVIGLFTSVALLVLVIAGLRYVASNGDPNTMAKSKNTIIYSGIGLLVSFTAFVIVNFALNNI